MPVYMPVCLCAYLCIPCVWLCMHLCMLVYASVYMCIPMNTHVYLHIPMYACVYLCMLEYIPMYAFVYPCIPMYTCVYQCMVKANVIILSCTHTLCTDIQIGFAHASYSFLEPSTSLQLITNVELVRDEGRQSEQTFQVQVSVWGPSEILGPLIFANFFGQLRHKFEVAILVYGVRVNIIDEYNVQIG